MSRADLAGSCVWILLASVAATEARGQQIIYGVDTTSAVLAIDVDAQTTTVIGNTTGLQNWSVAPGPSLTTLYIHDFNSGQYVTYDMNANSTTSTGVFTPGYAFGEGGDGFWYMNGSNSGFSGLLRFLPNNAGSITDIGGGPNQYAGDFATDNNGQSWGTMGNASPAFLCRVSRIDGLQSGCFSTGVGMLGLAFTLDGRMWVSDYPNGTIYEVNPVAQTITPRFTTGRPLADLASQRIPEPASLALFMGAVLLIAGRQSRRERRGRP